MKNPLRKFQISLFVSLGLHALITSMLIFSPNFFSTKKVLKKTEVELIDPQTFMKMVEQQKKLNDNKTGQIVEQHEKPINDESPDNSKYLSRHNQKVVRETQAAVHGKFKNTDSSAGLAKPATQSSKSIEKPNQESPIDKIAEKTRIKDQPKNILTSADGVSSNLKRDMKDLLPNFKPAPPTPEAQTVAEGGEQESSATDDHLKDVAKGMQTLLSTREFVYYSYYNRIKDKLRQYWEPKIKEKMERIVRQGRTIASNTDRVTRIVIVLDNSGTLVRVQIIGPSGVNDLDEAAVEAFRAAAPFPNPPRGIADPDGTIKIRWDFILEANNNNGLLKAARFAKARSESD